MGEWRQADGEDWAKIAASTAVKVLTPSESTKVRARLVAEGKEDRILKSRVVRRLKPGEQPGEAPTKRSRWCVRGDLDPDAVHLDSYSPTVSTQNIQVILHWRLRS